jgi:DNA gyrase subunit B
LTRVANKFATEYGISKTKLSGEDVREGLTAIISVKIADPQFEGQTKTKLGNSEVVGLVSSLVSDGLSEYFIENPKVANTILEKAVQARTARTAAKKARDLSRRKSTLESSTLPGKLADCSNRNPSETELFLVEGDSAGGSAKQGRDRQFQAILPFRGKILNVEKSRLGKLFKNNEIVSLITALGTGIGDDFDITKARYHKIVIMTDADVDGAHIRTLILTLMFRYMRPLVEAGYVYVAQPPLYKIKKGKTETYAYSDAEKDKKLKEIGTDKVSIQRYKGLGEMDAGQLWETTMDPESRKIVRINIEDEIKSDQTFQTLMGSDVTPRREFIQKHAKDVINIDI